MNRLPWIVVGAAALALLAFLFWYTPDRRAAQALSTPGPGEAAAVASNTAVASAAAAPSAPASARAPISGGGSPSQVIDAGAPDPTGPFKVDLGQATIYLNDPVEKRVMRFTLRLTVGNQVAAKECRLRREELVRMAYFLGSHRAAEGALGEEGRDRFARDLLDRYRNVIRTGSMDDVELVGYEVIPASKVPPRRAP